MRPCDIHALHHQEKIYLENGGFADLYYQRMKDRVKIVMMECVSGWDTCFCVSMGTNQAEDYSAAIRFEENDVLMDVTDEDLAPYFDGSKETEFKPEYIKRKPDDSENSRYS